MRCLICKEEFSNELETCPNCGKKLVPEDLDIELPILKEDSNSLEFEKTRAILPIEIEEDDSFSLVDDINKQIDNINEEVVTDIETNTKVQKIEEIDELATPQSVKKRKNILFYTGIISFLLLLIVVLLLFISTNNKNENVFTDYVKELENALQTYYDTNEIDDVIYVLEELKKDDEKVKEAQRKTRITCDSWILLYLNEDASNKAEFEEITDKYKELLNGIYRYAVVTKDGININLLTGSDYEDLTKKLDDVYSDSANFFDSLEYYTKKDYDKAYYMFSRIDRNNAYYEKSVTYLDKIIGNIIELMKNDITYLEINIDMLDDSSKLQKYTQIENIILDYNNLYVNVELSEKEEYQDILSIYTSKVSEYTEIVVNSAIDNSVQ